jgi:acetyltransferase-like isoleucine patch superfamily enzyme
LQYSMYLNHILHRHEKIYVPRGKHTYGPHPKIVGVPSLAVGSRIGSFCSIAPGLEFVFRGKHMVNWVSTYPFREKWNMDVPLNDLPAHDPIIVGNDVWIATNVKIVQGVTVGDGAVVAMESLVTRDVPPFAMVGGHPARIIRYRFSERQIADLLRIAWWNWPDDEIRAVVPLLTSDDIDGFIDFANRRKQLGTL